MKFYGHFDSDGKDICLGRSVFGNNKKIMVFDVDGLLLLHKKEYSAGMASGRMNYVLHHQSCEVVLQALKDYDKVVFWTAIEGSLDYLNRCPFDEAHQRIEGGLGLLSSLSMIKDLRIVSRNLRNVSAMQDRSEEITFEPLERVVQVDKTDDLMHKYQKAKSLVW